MSQHFLLTAAARSLSLGQVLRLSDEEAHAKLVEIRWSDNEGRPYNQRSEARAFQSLGDRGLGD
jgi:hypothetical protein